MAVYKKGSKGKNVTLIQQALGIKADGVFGVQTEEAVKAWQSSHGLDPDGIVGSLTWATLFPKAEKTKLVKSARKITEIIVHCTATPEGRNFTVADIRAGHLARGFVDIGYHYVIYLDGSVHEGRSIHQTGAHCTGHNQNSVGISYVGGVEADGRTPKDTRTKEQKAALVTLLADLCKLYKLPVTRIFGHYQFANKACPSFRIEPLREEVAKKLKES